MWIVFAGCQASSVPAAADEPDTWRMRPARVIAPSADAAQRRAIAAGCDVAIGGPVDRPLTVTLVVRPTDVPVLFTYETMSNAVAARVELRGGGGWRELATHESEHNRSYLRQVELPAADHQRHLRVTVRSTDPDATGREIRLGNLGLYRLAPADQRDYWLALGASLTQSAIQHQRFQEMAFKRFGRRPVVFNRAVGGWTSQDLRDRLDDILDQHPRAQVAIIHIGGNDISRNRPYPGGAARLERNLIAILTQLKQRGVRPILSRLTYRNYRGRPGVPPASNGSGPYVRKIFDPIIADHTPRFYDAAAERGIVNFYDHFKANPDQLARDGVHLNEAGQRAMQRLWLEQAGPIVFGKAAVPDE